MTTYNRFDEYRHHSTISISGDGLTITGGTNGIRTALGLFGLESDKHYFEFTFESVGSGTSYETYVGVGSTQTSGGEHAGQEDDSWGINLYDGKKVNNNIETAYGSAISVGSVISIALDLDDGKIWFGVDGTWLGSGDPANGTNPTFTGVSGCLYPVASPRYLNARISLNCGQNSFAYSVPSGFNAGFYTPYKIYTPKVIADDGFGYSTTFYNNYQYVRFGRYGAADCRSFFRFPDVDLEQGTSITDAFARIWWAGTVVSSSEYVTCSFNDAANSSAPGNISELNALTPTTATSNFYRPNAVTYDSSDISGLNAAVQEVLTLGEWSKNNALMLIIDNGNFTLSNNIAPYTTFDYTGNTCIAGSCRVQLWVLEESSETFDKSSSDSLAITGVTTAAYLTLLDNDSLDLLAITGITTTEYLYNVIGSDSLAITGITTKEYDNPIYEKISSDSLAITGVTTTEYLYNVIGSDNLAITGITTKEYDNPIYDVIGSDSLAITGITTKEYDNPIYEKISSDSLAITGITTTEYFIMYDVISSDDLVITGITTKEYDDPIYEKISSDDLAITGITTKEYDNPIYEKISSDDLVITGITTVEYLLTYEVSSYDELIIIEVTTNESEIEQSDTVLYVKDIQVGQDIPVDGIVDHHGNYVQSLSFMYTPLDLDKVGDDINTVTGSWSSSVIDVTRKSSVLSSLLFSNPSASALFRFILYDFNGVELITDILTGIPTPVDQDGLYVSEYQVVISYGVKEAAIIIEDVSIGSVDVYLTSI